MYAPHIRVSFGGTLLYNEFDGSDIWNCSINAVPQDGDLSGWDPDVYMTAIHANLSSWFSNSANYMAEQATLDYLKANKIAPDGKYADPTETHFYDYLPPVGGGVTATMPSFISMATTWTTAIQRGPGHLGRIYLPNFTVNGPGDRIGGSEASSLRAAALNLLTVIAGPDTSGVQVNPVVASKVNATNTLITGVAIGNVKDVQRRRKNALAETYISSPWPI